MRLATLGPIPSKLTIFSSLSRLKLIPCLHYNGLSIVKLFLTNPTQNLQCFSVYKCKKAHRKSLKLQKSYGAFIIFVLLLDYKKLMMKR